MHPEDLVSQSVHLKEEQLRKEEEKLKEMELRVQREIAERRQELVSSLSFSLCYYSSSDAFSFLSVLSDNQLAKEESLRNLESRLAAQSVSEF